MDFLAKKWVLDGYEVMQKLGDYRHSWGLMATFAHRVCTLQMQCARRSTGRRDKNC